MGTVLMFGWLIGMIVGIVAVVRRFDPEARRRDG